MTPNNSRLYVWAIIVVTAIGVGAMVLIDVLQPASLNVTLIEHVLAVVTPTLAVLLNLLKSVDNGREIRDVKQQALVAADAASVAAERAVATEGKVRDTAAAVRKLAEGQP